MLFDVQSSQTTTTPFCATFVFLNQAQFFQTEIKKKMDTKCCVFKRT